MILVFDTSTSHLAIGIADDAGVLLREFHADASADERGIHDARLASETAALLAATGASPKSIARIGLIVGPGSFTGLRIGLSFAKGFAFATGAGIIALTPHQVIAADETSETNGTEERPIVTSSYREDLLYVASADTPRDIRIVNRSELPSSLIPHPSSLPLHVLAKLTAESYELIQGDAIDSLEPLYLTEFNVGAR